MTNSKSKFDQLHESAFSRYTQGAGFLAGDVVKFKKNTPKTEWFQSKARTVQELIVAMMKTPGNLRVGVLKNEFPYSIGGYGASDQPAAMADIYVELSPANWAYPMTVPLEHLEVIKPTDNTIGGPVPDNLRDKKRVEKIGKKGKANSRTKIDDSQRQGPTQNVKLNNGTKWDDSKVGGGNLQNLPKTGLNRESVEDDSLEKAYSEVLLETENPGAVKKTVKLVVKRLPATNEWRVSYLENGRLNDDKSYYTTDKEDANATRKEMIKELKGKGIEVIGESLNESDEYNSCEYEPLGSNHVKVKFHDTVHSPVHQDEVPVTVEAEFTFSESQPINEFKEGWVLDALVVTDERNRPVTLTKIDSEYLSNRANDFIGRYNETVETESAVIDESLGTPVTLTIGKHTVARTKRNTGGPDPTIMVTFKFDNGYKIVEFFGDHELTDPSDKRIKHTSSDTEINKTLHHLGLPILDDIYSAFDQHDSSPEVQQAAEYDDLMGELGP